LVGGWLGSFWTVMDKSAFSLMVAGVAALAGLVILAFNRPLRAALGDDRPGPVRRPSR
jgi:proton-dependent oligopeptide transporter, POT family